MNSSNPVLSWFFLLLLFCLAMNAQRTSSVTGEATVPRLVNFTGKTTDAQGKAMAGIAGVTFAIYKEQSEGAPLWLETQNVQADTKGNYTVQLGATKPDGLPLDLFTSGEARWLGVTVNGGQEQPRVLLLSVPYALKAADAETVGGLPPSAFVLANKTQGTGTSAKRAPASTPAASKNSAAPANADITGKGTLDFIPMWDTTSDIINSLIFQKSSQIGINTTSPAATLDVNGKSDVRDTLTLFPKGTDSTLAVNGTAFKVDQTGKVAFVSGQTFPGTGTVTSVGLSAPTDFTVTGSPVTNGGTLGLNWNVAPTSANTANAIVKRDAAGNFSATTITATGQLIAQATVGNGNAISASSASPVATVIYGGASSTTGATWGVEGETFSSALGASGVVGIAHNSSSVGVTGLNDGTGGIGVRASATGVSGVGVYGSGDGSGVIGSGQTGVYGSSSTGSGVFGISSGSGSAGVFGSNLNGYGFDTNSNVRQARSAGGWVKAMVEVNAYTAPYYIMRCFNSYLSGAAAGTPPCGFNFTEIIPGSWLFDFGFEVDDRFVSATNVATTLGPSESTVVSACTLDTCSGLTLNQVLVSSNDPVSGHTEAYFYLVLY